MRSVTEVFEREQKATEVRTLYRRGEKGYGIRALAKRFDMPVNIIYGWVNGRTPMKRWTIPDLSPSPELSYVIGATLGDGNLYHSGKVGSDFLIRLFVKDYDFAFEYGKCLKKILGREQAIVTTKDKYYGVKAKCRLLYEFLEKPLDELKEYIEKFPADFLRGFWDAEGCIYVKEHKRGQEAKLLISGINFDLIRYVRKLLDNFNIKSHLFYRYPKNIHWKTQCHLVIQAKPDVIRFRELVGFAIGRKREKLDKVIYRGSNERKIPLSKDIINFYQRLSLSVSEVARITNFSRCTIYRRLKEYGFTRTRSQAQVLRYRNKLHLRRKRNIGSIEGGFGNAYCG